MVCSAQGHVYAMSDPFQERSVYPVFDIEWYPSALVEKNSAASIRRISAIRKLAQRASKFVNACDFDVEGETIGFNVLRYACDGKEKLALRAKFSTLTKEELVGAFKLAKPESGNGLALAGRVRHLVDFIWGVNLSRAISRSARNLGNGAHVFSIGRVQGPTLNYLVEREREIQEFVPLPYWKVSGVFRNGETELTAEYSKGSIGVKAEAQRVTRDCVGKEAYAANVATRTIQVGPPTPFSTGDLQKEAYRAFGYSPSKTLQLAERLYLGALISYPRTGSQRLPPSIHCEMIVRGIGRIGEYSGICRELLADSIKPVQGGGYDPAHPAIHPTGESPRRRLTVQEQDVFDLVVRRFLAAIGQSAVRKLVEIDLAVGEYHFGTSGTMTVHRGWMEYYGRYATLMDSEIPKVARGDRFQVMDVKVHEKFQPRPFRYNQSSLLERMEREKIGTKATRADIISTLLRRDYVDGESMRVTELGLSVVDAMARYGPSILSIKLTREIEEKLERLENGSVEEALVIRDTIRSMISQLTSIKLNEMEIGLQITTTMPSTVATVSQVLGACPVCKTGTMRILKSGKTHKRFVGCSNYRAGCRASAPLPQRGVIRATTKSCRHCSWPIVYIMRGKSPWTLCVNANCPGKRKAT